MSQTKKQPTRKTTKKPETETADKPIRDGLFKKGNTIGMETRFQPGHSMSCKYKAEYCDMLIEFFTQPTTRIDYTEKYYRGELTSKIPIVIGSTFPTFESFAVSIGVTYKTLINWTQTYSQFAEAHAHAMAIQEATVVEGAMTGVYDSNFAKFYATNKFGMKDRQEVDTRVTTDIDEKTLAMIKRVGERVGERVDGEKE